MGSPPEQILAALRWPARLYFYFGQETLFLDLRPLGERLADRLTSRSRWLNRLGARLSRQVEHWLHTNATRIVDDFLERVDESVRSFQFELRDRLEQAGLPAREAQGRAARLKAGGQTAVADEQAALERAIARVRGLHRGEV